MLFRAGDPADLTARILELLACPERWPALKANDRRFVEEERTWRNSVGRYRAIYGAWMDAA